MKKILFVIQLAFLISCAPQVRTDTKPVVDCNVEHVTWSESAVLYEVNIRQYTPEGTIEAFISHIPRLKELGVDILWLMPIHPIGEENRKGGLGSYYSVKDYKAVNPEFGTIDNLKALVNKAHEAGMYVILDWVANHTAWDHSWVTENPDWYKKDSVGNFKSPFDWTDVIQLDYNVPELQKAMIDAMNFWIVEADVDGYRCDVAGMVPQKFWEKARTSLEKVKPLFMLAEDEVKSGFLENAFDMNYAWHLHHIMNQIAKGEMNVDDITEYFAAEDSIYHKACYRMQFITNHDENSWNGTEFERLGEGVNAFAVMTFTIPGMPLLYTGQEVGLKKRLKFFTKDTVEYSESEYTEFYKKLIQLRKNNKMFWSGEAGGDFETLNTTNKDVFAFKRFNDIADAFIILNLSDESQDIIIPQGIAGAYNDYFAGESSVINEGEEMNLEPWAYKIYLEK